MYETFFGFKRRPFLLIPDVDSYVSIDWMEESCRIIERTVQNGEGISLVFGSAGMLAVFAQQKNVPPRAVREKPALLEEFQTLIRSQGIQTQWQ
jgi:hypothetical protein